MNQARFEYRPPVQQLRHLVKIWPDKIFLRQPHQSVWQNLSYKTCLDRVTKTALFLHSLDIREGDRILLFGKNSADWLIADWAISMIGAVSVPVFSSVDTDSLEYIRKHAQAKMMFVGKLDQPERYASIQQWDIPTVALQAASIECRYDLSEKENSQPIETELSFPERDLDDVMTIIYTSGSTGTPKGVVHTYRSYISACQSFLTLFKDSAGLGEERFLSYLPLAHITERVLGQGLCLYANNVDAEIQLSFVESLDTFSDNLKETSPTMFVSVPRLWQKFQAGVLDQVNAKKLRTLLRIPFLKGFVIKKIKRGLGLQDTRIFASGSAPISSELLQWFESIDIHICQGWGMTETNAAGTTQLPFRSNKKDSIGRASPNVELKIGDNKELLIRSPCMMSEYYKQPELTRDAFDKEGFFKTGDQAKQDHDGYFYIIGRVKDIFKTAKGKYVAPAPIEASLSHEDNVDMACVIGSSLPQPIALVVLSELALSKPKDEIEKEFIALRESLNSQLQNHEKLAGFLLIEQAWTQEQQLITPTLKIRRQAIESFYQERIEHGLKSTIEWD